MRGAFVLAALLALCSIAIGRAPHEAPAGVARVWFDGRQLFARPMVSGLVDGKPRVLLLDTGATEHVFSFTTIDKRRVELTAGTPLLDFEFREHPRSMARVSVSVDGLGALPPGEVSFSDWVDDLGSRLPGEPRFDGVLHPQSLVRDGGALLLDLRKGELRETTWPDALARLESENLVVAAEGVADGPHFVVPVRVGSDELRLAIDTGAPQSLVWAPRSSRAPAGGTRVWKHTSRVRVGDVVRDLEVAVLEPLEQPSIDGVLGMDVLRSCAIALDRKRVVVRCESDARAARSSASSRSVFTRDPMRPEYVCIDPGERLCLREMVNGDYQYDGDRIRAVFRTDGTFQVESTGGGHMLAMRSTHDETRWLLDSTALLRYQQVHAQSLERSFDFLPGHLQRVWADGSYSAAERREVLFRIWDQAAEPNDPELGAAGSRARRVIERFVRRELPSSSPDGFSAEELARLNQLRPSGPRFDPYRYEPSSDRDEL